MECEANHPATLDAEHEDIEAAIGVLEDAPITVASLPSFPEDKLADLNLFTFNCDKIHEMTDLPLDLPRCADDLNLSYNCDRIYEFSFVAPVPPTCPIPARDNSRPSNSHVSASSAIHPLAKKEFLLSPPRQLTFPHCPLFNTNSNANASDSQWSNVSFIYQKQEQQADALKRSAGTTRLECYRLECRNTSISFLDGPPAIATAGSVATTKRFCRASETDSSGPQKPTRDEESLYVVFLLRFLFSNVLELMRFSR